MIAALTVVLCLAIAGALTLAALSLRAERADPPGVHMWSGEDVVPDPLQVA